MHVPSVLSFTIIEFLPVINHCTTQACPTHSTPSLLSSPHPLYHPHPNHPPPLPFPSKLKLKRQRKRAQNWTARPKQPSTSSPRSSRPRRRARRPCSTHYLSLRLRPHNKSPSKPTATQFKLTPVHNLRASEAYPPTPNLAPSSPSPRRRTRSRSPS